LNKKFNSVVVGGGIAGIISALLESNKGKTVLLIESSSQLGGLLNSSYNGKNYFDYGTHIFSQSRNDELNKILFDEFSADNCIITNKISVGNYFNGIMNNKNCFVDANSLEDSTYYKGCYDFITANRDIYDTNLESFSRSQMGETFYEYIFKPTYQKYFREDPRNLDISCFAFFDMSRIIAFDQITTIDLLSRNNKLKLAHHERQGGINKYYPIIGGIGSIIKKLENKLIKNGVSINLNFPIEEISYSNNKFQNLKSKTETIEFDSIIWTIPQFLLCKYSYLPYKPIAPNFVSTRLLHFTFNKKILTESTYINVFDQNLLSGRITFYQNLTQTDNFSCTVEVLGNENVSDLELPELIIKELLKMNLIESSHDLVYNELHSIKQGFPVLSIPFVQNQKSINLELKNNFSNLKLLGRASGNTFFLEDVLNEVYEELARD
jgi:protoporphyrinogen oxidase